MIKVIKVTMIDAEASSHEEFASIILPYGEKGYKRAYINGEPEEMILATSELDLEDEEEDIEFIAEEIRKLDKNQRKFIELPNGHEILITKE